MHDYSTEVAGRTLEYIDDEHIYLVDGVIVPSITQIVRAQLPDKYAGVPDAVLQRAADRGTAIHEAIERYIRSGEDSDMPEVKSFQFLQGFIKFSVIECETPVILFTEGVPVAAGRIDLFIRDNAGRAGIADIKTTARLDREYLAAQLNLYRIAYRQTYHVDCDFLAGIHLRENKRRYVPIPVNFETARQAIDMFMEGADYDRL